AARGRIAMVLRILGGFDELVDDVLGCRHVGVAHAEVDDVFAARACLGLQVVHDREDVRRQALDPVELLHRGGSPLSVSRDDTEASRKVSTNGGATRTYATPWRRAPTGQLWAGRDVLRVGLSRAVR